MIRARGRLRHADIGMERLLLLFGTNYLLHESFKTRLAAKRIEQRLNFNVGDI